MSEPAGLVGPHRESHEPRLLATNFLADGVEPVEGFLAWNGAQGIGERWGMLGNDRHTNCGPCATAHNNMAKANNLQLGGQLGRPKFNGVLGTFYAYGRAMGWVGQPPQPPDEPDQGVDNKTWLGFLYEQGIIYGYGEIPLNCLDWFAQVSHGAIVGLIIDGNRAVSDFQAEPRIPWGPMPGASDGHDVLLILTNTDGSGGLVTWGGVQPFTPEFRAQITDAWIIYDKDDPTIDHAALQAALVDVHGTLTTQPSTPPRGGFWHRIAEEIKELV